MINILKNIKDLLIVQVVGKKRCEKKTFKSEKKKKIQIIGNVLNKVKIHKNAIVRSKTLKYLENKYPKEWFQYQIDFQTNPKLRY